MSLERMTDPLGTMKTKKEMKPFKRVNAITSCINSVLFAVDPNKARTGIYFVD